MIWDHKSVFGFSEKNSPLVNFNLIVTKVNTPFVHVIFFFGGVDSYWRPGAHLLFLPSGWALIRDWVLN